MIIFCMLTRRRRSMRPLRSCCMQSIDWFSVYVHTWGPSGTGVTYYISYNTHNLTQDGKYHFYTFSSSLLLQLKYKIQIIFLVYKKKKQNQYAPPPNLADPHPPLIFPLFVWAREHCKNWHFVITFQCMGKVTPTLMISFNRVALMCFIFVQVCSPEYSTARRPFHKRSENFSGILLQRWGIQKTNCQVTRTTLWHKNNC